MFDLEQSIADWREQMLAAGIKFPVPLEELEIHLREEVERQIQSGANEQQAFETAVLRIGQGIALKTEFIKAKGLFDFMDQSKPANIYRILGVLWLVQCSWFFIRSATSPVAVAIILYFPHFWQFFTVFFTSLALAGVMGSIFLLRGAKLGVSIIRIIAVLEFLLCASECATQDHSFGEPDYWFGIFSLFSLITIWLLRSPKQKEPKLVPE